MGASAAVAIHPTHVADSRFRELLQDKDQRIQLFKLIATSSEDGHISLKDRISLKKLLNYFNDKSNQFGDLAVNIQVLEEAFKQSSHKSKHESQMTQKEFHTFIPTLFLFSKLFEIFYEADKTVVEDNKVFKGEFVKAKNYVSKLPGVQIGDISDEEWEAEFVKLDKSKDGHISFREFCTYATKNLVNPTQFADAAAELEDDSTPAADPSPRDADETPQVSESIAEPLGQLHLALNEVFDGPAAVATEVDSFQADGLVQAEVAATENVFDPLVEKHSPRADVPDVM